MASASWAAAYTQKHELEDVLAGAVHEAVVAARGDAQADPLPAIVRHLQARMTRAPAPTIRDHQLVDTTGDGRADAALADTSGGLPDTIAPLDADPRWDDAGFKRWTDTKIDGRHAVAWLKAGFVRYLAKQHRDGVPGTRLPHRQALERIPGAYHLGAPPDDAALFYVAFAWQGHGGIAECSVDPCGHILHAMADVLEQEHADDDDLVFMMWSSIFLYDDDGRSTNYGADRSPQDGTEAKLYHAINDNFTRMLCFWRVRTILLPRLYPGAGEGMKDTPFLDRLWAMLDVVLAAYCQRIVSLRSDNAGADSSQELIRLGTDPSRFENLEDLFMKQLQASGEGDRTLVFGMLQSALRTMPPIRDDAIGFSRFCNEAQLAWLYVWYVKELAARHDAPIPRRQELRPTGYLLGVPPAGRRKFVTSHGWETETHPCPGGGKFVRLAKKLTQLEAADDDVVFFDFCSVSQDNKMGRKYAKDEPWKDTPERDATAPAYFEKNNMYFEKNNAYYPPRTPKETKLFKFAMWEMGRLYSFHECEVIVLPTIEESSSFPTAPDVWGMVNTKLYHNRGWCCAEFAIASYCGIIKNLSDPDVATVLASRKWPKDNASYAEMMRLTCSKEVAAADPELSHHPTLGVDFTNKGDRAAVKYNFFKMALSMS